MANPELISPSVLAEMKSELESLSNTEPGAREFSEVIAELMPLIRGCRDRGHSWSKIADSLKKFHSGMSISRLKKYAYELDPSLKSTSKTTQKSLIPENESQTASKKTSSKKSAAVDF